MHAVTVEESVDPRVGTVIQDRYRVLARLSAGAMGVVYRAERLQLGRTVAVKFLHPHFSQVDDFMKRFAREALTMSRLNHPHCVSVIDFGECKGPYIVMDFITGTTLAQLVAEGPQPAARVFPILRQILAGLAHAHQQEIIHRDIKPANIMLSQATGTGDHVHILDFGLAKLRDVDMTMSGIVTGTPSYMSPEQTRGEKLDERSDIYSAGIVLFELLTGEKPFRADETAELLRLHREAPPPALRDKHPAGNFSAPLEEVVFTALAKAPGARFQSALAFAEALQAVPETALVRGARAPSAFPAPGLHRARSPEAEAPTMLADSGVASEPGSTTGDAAPLAIETTRPRPRRARRLAVLGLLGAAGWGLAGAPGLPAGTWSRLEDRARRTASQLEDRARHAASRFHPAPAASAAAATPVSLEAALELQARGDTEAALRALHALRRNTPRDPEVLLALGTLYCNKSWWAEGLAAYREALILTPGYRSKAVIIDHAIRALERPQAAGKARTLLLRQIGSAALPALRTAARRARSPAARRELESLVQQIQAAPYARAR
jgi:serine/threonine-protein kinase